MLTWSQIVLYFVALMHTARPDSSQLNWRRDLWSVGWVGSGQRCDHSKNLNSTEL